MMKARWLSCLALILLASVVIHAGNFPSKPVEAIVPWNAGGGGDLVFRALSSVFQKHANGQPLLIKNIGGAAGMPGTIEFMRARPDCYTIIHWNGAQTIKTFMSVTPYKATQFPAVCGVVSDAPYVLVKGDSPFKTLKDFVDYAKANPGKVNFGNAGIGGGGHLNQILFTDATDVDVATIPFQGGGPLITGLLSGQVDAITAVAPEGVTHIQSGQLRILCVLIEERIAQFPDVPTAKEFGYDVVVPQRRGVLVPEGTPQECIDELREIFRNVCADPEFQQRMKDMGSNIDFIDGQAYMKSIEQDCVNFEKIIKDMKLGDIYGKK